LKGQTVENRNSEPSTQNSTKLCMGEVWKQQRKLLTKFIRNGTKNSCAQY